MAPSLPPEAPMTATLAELAVPVAKPRVEANRENMVNLLGWKDQDQAPLDSLSTSELIGKGKEASAPVRESSQSVGKWPTRKPAELEVGQTNLWGT